MRPVKSIIPALIILTPVTNSYADYDIDSYEEKYEAFLDAVRTRDGEAATRLYRELLKTKGKDIYITEDCASDSLESMYNRTNREEMVMGRLGTGRYGVIYWDYDEIRSGRSLTFLDYCKYNDYYYASLYDAFEDDMGIWWEYEYFYLSDDLDTWEYLGCDYADNYFYIVNSSDGDPYDPYWFNAFDRPFSVAVWCRDELIAEIPASYYPYFGGMVSADMCETVYPVLLIGFYDYYPDVYKVYFGISFDGETYTFSEFETIPQNGKGHTSMGGGKISNVTIGGLEENDRIYASVPMLNAIRYSDDYGLTWSGRKYVIPESYPDSYFNGNINVIDDMRDSFGVVAIITEGEEDHAYYFWTEDAADNFDMYTIRNDWDVKSSRVRSSKHITNGQVFTVIPDEFGDSDYRYVFRTASIDNLDDWDCSVIAHGYFYSTITHGLYEGSIIPVVGLGGGSYVAYCEDYTALEDIGLVAMQGENGITVKWDETPVPYNSFNIYRRTGNYTKSDSSRGTLLNENPIMGLPPYEYIDRDIETGATYTYWLEAIDASGISDWYGPVTCMVGVKPFVFNLAQNRPNPVSSRTTKFIFSVPEVGKADLYIYDLSGRKVAVAVDRYLEAGEYEVPYTVALPPGVYMYRLNACGESACRKMVVLE